MPVRFFVLLLFFFNISVLPSSWVYAAERLECKTCYGQKKEILQEHLQTLELAFSKFRWAEANLRWLYYERIWPARFKAQDPLSKPSREIGSNEENRLLKQAESWTERSSEAANQIAAVIHQMQHYAGHYETCCPERNFEQCVQNAFGPLTDKLEALGKDFDLILENERVYRNEVVAASGGPRGLYPQDALEISDAHEDYYWRFEAERGFKRHQEDRKMIEHFHGIRWAILEEGHCDACCYECGKLTSGAGAYEI